MCLHPEWNYFGKFLGQKTANKTIIELLLGYLIDSNAVAHSVDSDIFYAVIYLSAHSKTCSNIYFSK